MSPTITSKNMRMKVDKDWYHVKDFTWKMDQLTNAWNNLNNVTCAAATTTTAYVTTYQNTTGSTTNYYPWGPPYGAPPTHDDSGRQPPPREFNRYLNASDLLEEFIEYLGSQGVRASEFMSLPVELFVKWLVIRACEQDQETSDVTLALPPAVRHRHHARCLGCGRYMRTAPVALHEPCVPRYFARHPTTLKEKLCAPISP